MTILSYLPFGYNRELTVVFSMFWRGKKSSPFSSFYFPSPCSHARSQSKSLLAAFLILFLHDHCGFPCVTCGLHHAQSLLRSPWWQTYSLCIIIKLLQISDIEKNVETSWQEWGGVGIEAYYMQKNKDKKNSRLPIWKQCKDSRANLYCTK